MNFHLAALKPTLSRKGSLFQWFQPFNPFAPFEALRQFKVQGCRLKPFNSPDLFQWRSGCAPGYTLIASTRRPCALAAAH